MSQELDQKVAKMSEKEQQLLKLRHTTEHVLHAAMQKRYPSLKKAMGPATDEGFYFDFDYSQKISEADFPEIEKEMKSMIKQNLKMVREEISEEEARKIFRDNPYKLEWVDEIVKRNEPISVYKMMDHSGNTVDLDLCSGPHVDYTSRIKAFKLLKIAGAYWHGDEKNKMLTRIYGTAFPSKEELEQFIWRQEEAEKRDHRKLGKELDLFTFSEYVGSGFPLYTPKGALIRRLLNNYVEDIQSKQKYTQVWTPQVAKAELFKKSGHYDKYKNDMFIVKSHYSEEEFFLKPMNCPQHTQIYASQPRSYRDLPLRYTDFAMLYRDEKPGELSGLARVRSFSQDDCHIFATEEQVDREIDMALSMTKQIMDTFGFIYRYRLSTRDPEHPEKYLGDPKIWDKVEAWAVKIMERNNINYYIAPGEAAFYAPKMDLMATDALGREWQLSTVQIDFVMPERFDLTYTSQDGSPKRPVMIHRAIIGSSERMLMILLEHYGGKFPVWLSPIQLVLIPIADRHIQAAKNAENILSDNLIRVQTDLRNESLQSKIRDAALQKVPFMGIIGDKEISSGSELPMISVRSRDDKNIGSQSLDQFLGYLKSEIQKKH